MHGCHGQGQTECHGSYMPIYSVGFPGLRSAKEAAEVKVVPEALHIALATPQCAKTAKGTAFHNVKQ